MNRGLEQLSREEVAKRDLGTTAIAPSVAWLLAVGVAAIVAILPLLQAWQEVRAYAQGRREQPWPGALEIAKAFPGALAGLPKHGEPLDQLRHANALLLREMEDYENRLEEESLLRGCVLGPMQSLLLKVGAGNESTYPGRNRWLFYRPGVDYVTGPGFLASWVLRSRARQGGYLDPRDAPDPVPAILRFHRELRNRGVELIVLPAPVKPSVHPEKFTARYLHYSTALQNSSYGQFIGRLYDAGIVVLDLAGEFVRRKVTAHEPQYLERDTHWTASAMEFAASRLAALLREQGWLSGAPAQFTRQTNEVVCAGDIAAMLNLREPAALWPPQSLEVHPVCTPAGEPWQPSTDAEILLLGDSFANIYSMKELGWGESAGLAEQLSFFLQEPVDRITQNDSGAFATRQALARQMAQGEDRLQGKKVVVWEFAARELAIGNWKVIPLPDSSRLPHTPSSGPSSLPSEKPMLVLEGTVRNAAGMPKPGTVPYRDGITALHLGDVITLQGENPGRQVVVYLWGMRNNQLTDAARLKPGQRIRLEASPWSSVEGQYGTFTRVELDDPDFLLFDLPTFWGTLE